MFVSLLPNQTDAVRGRTRDRCKANGSRRDGEDVLNQVSARRLSGRSEPRRISWRTAPSERRHGSIERGHRYIERRSSHTPVVARPSIWMPTVRRRLLFFLGINCVELTRAKPGSAAWGLDRARRREGPIDRLPVHRRRVSQQAAMILVPTKDTGRHFCANARTRTCEREHKQIFD